MSIMMVVSDSSASTYIVHVDFDGNITGGDIVIVICSVCFNVCNVAKDTLPTFHSLKFNACSTEWPCFFERGLWNMYSN